MAEIFNVFNDDSGKFKESIGNDVKGLLSLYESSFLLMHGENILDEAREFTSKHLQEFAKQNEDESYLSKLVGHALKVPLHWRVPRLEARWFIDLCGGAMRSRTQLSSSFLSWITIYCNPYTRKTWITIYIYIYIYIKGRKTLNQYLLSLPPIPPCAVSWACHMVILNEKY